MPHVDKGNGAKPKAPMKRATKARVPGPAFQHGKDKFTYALKAWSVERRGGGWFYTETTPSILGNKPYWRGPYESVENAGRAIARNLVVEITDRHTRAIEIYKIDRNDPLFGLEPESKL